MTEVIGVRFRGGCKEYYFDPHGITVEPNQFVIVETAQGLEYAQCVSGNHEVEDDSVVQPLRPLVRVATENDDRTYAYNKTREKNAFEVCQKKIAERGLDMKLVRVESNFDGSKIIFFFTSDGRVDFRELVRDLAGVFRARIELRQIGVRDEAKMLGGLGACGRPICCGAFLADFQPVSIKMAKEQNLSLNPTKISGQCGRLMCCLKYEQDYYEETLKKLPRVGKEIMTPDGVGYVTEINVLKEKVKVRVRTDDSFEVREYGVEDVRKLAPGERPTENELPPKVVEKPQPVEKKEEEEEPKRKRYPRPKAVKTMNTYQYMELHAVGDEPEREEKPEEAASDDKKDGGKPKNGGKRPPRNDNRRSRGPRVRKDNAPEEAGADKKSAAPTEAPKKEE